MSRIDEIKVNLENIASDCFDSYDYHTDVSYLLAKIQRYEKLLKDSSAALNSIKSELNASVYTVTDDEFGIIYYVRDMIDLALKEDF